MKNISETAGTIASLTEAIEKTINNCNAKGLLILSCDANNYTPGNLNTLLTSILIPVAGGIFPALIKGNQLLEKGNIVMAIPKTPKIQILKNLSSNCIDFDDDLDETLVNKNTRTVLVISDCMATRVNTLLSSLFNVFGLEINYIGGGAGSLDLKNKHNIITNNGLLQDVAILAALESESGIGVSHGMKSVSGPHKITDVKQNTICTIDWQPAYDYFKALIQKNEPNLVETDDEFPVSKEFCIAVNRIGNEKVVREPITKKTDGALMVLPEVYEGEFIDIVRATKDLTIQSALDSLKLAQAAYKGNDKYKTVLCFDCSGRWKFLGNRFHEELEAIQDDSCETIGVLTLGGEIANSGMDFLDYYNRTCVIGVLED